MLSGELKLVKSAGSSIVSLKVDFFFSCLLMEHEFANVCVCIDILIVQNKKSIRFDRIGETESKKIWNVF